MAVLNPSKGRCTFETRGEQRLAERLEQEPDDDYPRWYNVPVGPKQSHPDFVAMHPRHGLLLPETEDWKLETILQATRPAWDIHANGQARFSAIQVVDVLKRDPPPIQADGPYKGGLAFPWEHRVVFTNITRRQFDDAGLHEATEPRYLICKDEMLEKADPDAFQKRLWDMFPHSFGSSMSLGQIDCVRRNMFPQVRVQVQGALFNESDPDAEMPDIMRLIDLQQEQLARSLGDGHGGIHGVAGSGKTMISAYRAECLAKACTPSSKAILIRCFNEPLGVRLHSVMGAKGLSDRVHVGHFHSWRHRQLTTHGQAMPAQNMPVGAKIINMVDHMIRPVERSQIPGRQYQAEMIDEGHDFAPEWLRLVTQMVDPATNSLVMHHQAQSIYERARSKQFSLKNFGIQAHGRTTILKINYRNTLEILHTASLAAAADFLTADDKDGDGIPLLKPVSCGRDGQAPVIIKLPTLRDEAFAIADHLASAHKEGFAWGDMAVLCADWTTMDLCASALAQRKLPHRVRIRSGDYNPGADAIQVVTMKVSKGLEFPVGALPGVGHLPAPGEDETEAAGVFYVAATRATQRLVMEVGGDGGFEKRLRP